MKVFKYSLPLILIGLSILVFHLCGGWCYIQLDSLRDLRGDLINFVVESPWLTALYFFMGYVLFSLTVLPGLLVLDLVGGFLFPQPYSTLLIITACAVGAAIHFVAARYAFRDLVRKSNKNFIEKIQLSVEKNQVNYLLLARLIPVVPFGVLNFSIAVLRVRFSTFIWTTFVGSIPLIYCYTQAGRGLGILLEENGPITLGDILNGPMVTALIGMFCMFVIPLIFAKVKRARD